MRSQKTVDLDHAPASQLQRGQWVVAGKGGSKGRFVKVSKAGVIYVAWTRQAWQLFNQKGV